MCGLVGFSGIKGKTFDPNAISFLLYLNSKERSSIDSTGIYSPVQGLIKDTGSAKDFLAATSLIADNVILGHVRNRSVGMANQENAHPYICGDVVGIHNGTLDNHMKLGRDNDIQFAEWGTDSELLMMLLDKTKNPKILEKVSGSVAILTAKLSAPETLYAYRNIERPLYRGRRPEGMYMSSEKEGLEVIGCTAIKEFIQNRFYTITNSIITSHIPLKKALVITKPATNHFYQNYGNNTPVIQDFDDEAYCDVMGYGGRAARKPNVLGCHTPIGFKPPKESLTDAYNSLRTPYIPTKDLVGHWLQCSRGIDNSINGKCIHIIKDNWYYVTGDVPEEVGRKIAVLGEEGRRMEISKLYFHYTNFRIKAKSKVVVMRPEIFTLDGQTVVAKYGDLLEVSGVNKASLPETADCYETSNPANVYTIVTRALRPATYDDLSVEDIEREIEEEEERTEKKKDDSPFKGTFSSIEPVSDEMSDADKKELERMTKLQQQGIDYRNVETTEEVEDEGIEFPPEEADVITVEEHMDSINNIIDGITALKEFINVNRYKAIENVDFKEAFNELEDVILKSLDIDEDEVVVNIQGEKENKNTVIMKVDEN